MMMALLYRDREFEKRHRWLWLRGRIEKVIEKMTPLLEQASSPSENLQSLRDLTASFYSGQRTGVRKEEALTFRQLER